MSRQKDDRLRDLAEQRKIVMTVDALGAIVFLSRDERGASPLLNDILFDPAADLAEQRKIGQRIRLARKSKRLTLEQVAEAAETSVQVLTQLEKGADMIAIACHNYDGKESMKTDNLYSNKIGTGKNLREKDRSGGKKQVP